MNFACGVGQTLKGRVPFCSLMMSLMDMTLLKTSRKMPNRMPQTANVILSSIEFQSVKTNRRVTGKKQP